jgi:phenylacetate-coenzyme A ligase PaaK-like adenylate-forming protein
MKERFHSIKSFTDAISSVNENNFQDIALSLFQFQAIHNPIYQSFLNYLGVHPTKITAIDQIPFLPIGFFKSGMVKTGNWRPSTIFISSGTAGITTSQHAINDIGFYLQHATQIFERIYGSLKDYHILALLPSYLERQGSSLIAMMEHFIRRTESPHSGFYLYNQDEFISKADFLKNDKRKVMVWGVSFALLDLAEKNQVDLSKAIVMETGGMKGRRKEWVREELHQFLCARFNVKSIHSEYGMTELLSQVYSNGDGLFKSPNSLKIVIKDLNDPFQTLETGKTGLISIIDLANAHSCAFIQTQDLGRITQNGYFEVLGRMDNSDVRGCNLLVG